MKRVVVLGSTGSLGQSTLEVLEKLGSDYELLGLSANANWRRLNEQVLAHKPKMVALADAEAAARLKERLLSGHTEVLTGDESIERMVGDERVDIVVLAIAGAAGLPAAVAAVEAGKTIALGCKEVLVSAGELLTGRARETGAQIIPVDSEHSAILQVMRAGQQREVSRIILTASGGPFYDESPEVLARVTLEQALRHPTWRMGQELTVNSATMMNKAMEVVEARWLFDLEPSQIEIVIHPESVVHAIIEFCDGACVAQFAAPDMRLPVQYALTQPKRLPCVSAKLDLCDIGALRFQKPDTERFPALRLGHDVLETGGTMGAVLCAANEVAVKKFVDGKIRFVDIVPIVKQVMSRHRVIPSPSLQDIRAADGWARQEAERGICD